MTSRTVLLVVAVAFLSVGAAQVTRGQAPGPVAQFECSLTVGDHKGAVSPGFVLAHQGASYRCMPTFDHALRANGAEWVRVEADGTIGARLPQYVAGRGRQ